MIDTFTLILHDAIVITATSFILLLYMRLQKTYSGFGLWLLSMLLTGLVYFIMLSRQVFIPAWASILLVNFTFPLAAIIRYDGTLRFTFERSLNKKFYMIPVFQLIIAIYFTFFQNEIIIRNFTLTLVICYMAVSIAILFFKRSREKKTIIYLFAGYLQLLFSILLFLRAFFWIFTPQRGLFDSSSLHIIYFIFITIYEFGWGVCIMMLNGKRLEDELIESKDKLDVTVKELITAISELKTLSGLVPICSSCKSIRDDKGYWNQLEAYVEKHSDARFSHGICPDCARKLYPDLYPDSDSNDK